MFNNLPLYGAYVELGSILQDVFIQKPYENNIKKFLSELLVGNILITSNLKFVGKVNFQLKDDFFKNLIVSDCSNNLEVRATSKNLSLNLDNNNFFSNTNLIVSIFSNDEGEVYQSIVKVKTSQVDSIMNDYYQNSVQLNCHFLINFDENKVNGIAIQQIPDEKYTNLDYVDQIILKLKNLSYNKLNNTPLYNILDNLYKDYEISLFAEKKINLYCLCSSEKIMDIIRNFDVNEIFKILRDDHYIKITCDFCSKTYKYSELEVKSILNLER